MAETSLDPMDPIPVDATPRLAVALSGGGNRAALLTIGGLLALVDRGMNQQVAVVSSVSGGSITNAVVATKVDLTTLAPRGLDEAAGVVIHGVARNVLSVPVVLGLFALVIAGGNWILASATDLSRGALVWLSVLGLLLLLFGTGRILAESLQHVYLGGRRHRTHLGDVAGRNLGVAHEFCSTDLVTGLPVTFSTIHAGVARRRAPVKPSARGVAVEDWPSARRAMNVVVRASAAFPGIAPKYLRFAGTGVEARRPDGVAGSADDRLGRLRRTAFCSDGGVWNNLATQALREEGEDATSGLPLVCVNASAPGKTSPPFLFGLPGIAVVWTMLRTMLILNRNTVEPRVASINRDVLGRAYFGRFPHHQADPLTVVSDMRSIASNLTAMRVLAVDGHGTTMYRDGRDTIATSELDRLEQCGWWQALRALDDDSEITVGTKLTRIRGQKARALIVRGYANTWVASLFIQPLRERDLQDTDIAARIRAWTP